jgi:Protein of unknown function (DUF3467)
MTTTAIDKQPADGNAPDGQAQNHQPRTSEGSRLRLDTAELKSSYCNVCNASSTREEVVLSLGINQNWEIKRGGGEIDVKLLHRIILSPFAAKRLSAMLSSLMQDYEAQHGELR